MNSSFNKLKLFIEKMSVQPNCPFVVKNILVDTYLDHTNKKLNYNKKPLVIEYIIPMCYILQLIKTLVCLRLNDIQLRLYLFDETLFLGGIRQYNTYGLIILCIFGLYMFKHLHLNFDKRQMKWIVMLEVIRGKSDPYSNSCFKYNMDHFNEIQILVFKTC